jgi:hypothetical protein
VSGSADPATLRGPEAPRVVEPRRLLPLLRVLALLAGGLVACNAALLAVFGADPPALQLDESPAQWADLEAQGRKVAGALAQQPIERLAVVVGASTAIHGLDPEQLAQLDPLHRRWLVLGAGGHSFTKLEVLTDTLASMAFAPPLMAVAAHPSWLVGEAGADANEDDDRHSPWNWTGRHRAGVRNAAVAGLYVARLDLGVRAGFSPAAFFAPDPEPWLPRPPPRRPPPADVFVKQERQFAGFGWFDSRSYEAAAVEPQAESLVRMVTGMRAAGSRVILVLMPEDAALRARLPAVGLERLQRVLADAFGADVPPILDLRDAMPDAAFRDHVHIDHRPGCRDVLTSRLMERIAALDPHGAEPR